MIRKISFKVYAVVHTKTEKCVYVGGTTQRLNTRMYDHMGKYGYLGTLFNCEDLEVVVIETHDYKAFDREKYWMQRLLAQGHPLVNRRIPRRKYY